MDPLRASHRPAGFLPQGVKPPPSEGGVPDPQRAIRGSHQGLTNNGRIRIAFPRLDAHQPSAFGSHLVGAGMRRREYSQSVVVSHSEFFRPKKHEGLYYATDRPSDSAMRVRSGSRFRLGKSGRYPVNRDELPQHSMPCRRRGSSSLVGWPSPPPDRRRIPMRSPGDRIEARAHARCRPRSVGFRLHS